MFVSTRTPTCSVTTWLCNMHVQVLINNDHTLKSQCRSFIWSTIDKCTRERLVWFCTSFALWRWIVYLVVIRVFFFNTDNQILTFNLFRQNRMLVSHLFTIYCWTTGAYGSVSLVKLENTTATQIIQNLMNFPAKVQFSDTCNKLKLAGLAWFAFVWPRNFFVLKVGYVHFLLQSL